MLIELIDDRILFLDRVSSWEEAIRISSRSLIDQEFIKESYLDSMIDCINEFGSYIILCDGVAMPHTRPEHGALKTGFSFLKLNQGVLFPETEIPVTLIFTMSAADSESHIEAIMQLADIIGDEDTLVTLQNISTKEELLNILKKGV